MKREAPLGGASYLEMKEASIGSSLVSFQLKAHLTRLKERTGMFIWSIPEYKVYFTSKSRNYNNKTQQAEVKQSSVTAEY